MFYADDSEHTSEDEISQQADTIEVFVEQAVGSTVDETKSDVK